MVTMSHNHFLTHSPSLLFSHSLCLIAIMSPSLPVSLSSSHPLSYSPGYHVSSSPSLLVPTSPFLPFSFINFQLLTHPSTNHKLLITIHLVSHPSFFYEPLLEFSSSIFSKGRNQQSYPHYNSYHKSYNSPN